MAAGNALQFREFVDHARLQVVLGQRCSAACLQRVGAHLRGDDFGQRRHACDLVGHRAQLGLVGHAGKPRAHRLQALLQVFIEEELGVGKARTDDPLVAFGDFGHVLGLDIGDADKLLGQGAAVIQHREEFLVDLHGFDQCFLRHRQEVAFETAQHRRRPFDQVDHLLQVVVADACAAAGLPGRRLHFVDDAGTARVRIHQHMRRTQRIDVVAGRRQRHRAFMHEAVPARDAVAAHAQQLGRNHRGAEQQHQPLHRPREGVFVRAPAHRLGDGHRGDGLAQDLRQQVGRARARRHCAMHETLALGVAGAFQRGPVDAGLGGETGQRLGRLTSRIQRDVEIRPQHFRALLRLLGGHARQQHRQATRGGQRFGIATGDGNAALFQAAQHAIEEGLRQTRQRLDRQLFGAQFDQQGKLFAHVRWTLLVPSAVNGRR